MYEQIWTSISTNTLAHDMFKWSWQMHGCSILFVDAGLQKLTRSPKLVDRVPDCHADQKLLRMSWHCMTCHGSGCDSEIRQQSKSQTHLSSKLSLANFKRHLHVPQFHIYSNISRYFDIAWCSDYFTSIPAHHRRTKCQLHGDPLKAHDLDELGPGSEETFLKAKSAGQLFFH